MALSSGADRGRRSAVLVLQTVGRRTGQTPFTLSITSLRTERSWQSQPTAARACIVEVGGFDVGAVSQCEGRRTRAGPLRLSEPAVERVTYDFGARVLAGLLLNVRSVGLDRAHRQKQLAGDLGVREAKRD